jgi:hypothetical protein
VTANNVCKQPSDKVTINNPVPEHMTLVANSATALAARSPIRSTARLSRLPVS